MRAKPMAADDPRLHGANTIELHWRDGTLGDEFGSINPTGAG